MLMHDMSVIDEIQIQNGRLHASGHKALMNVLLRDDFVDYIKNVKDLITSYQQTGEFEQFLCFANGPYTDDEFEHVGTFAGTPTFVVSKKIMECAGMHAIASDYMPTFRSLCMSKFNVDPQVKLKEVTDAQAAKRDRLLSAIRRSNRRRAI